MFCVIDDNGQVKEGVRTPLMSNTHTAVKAAISEYVNDRLLCSVCSSARRLFSSNGGERAAVTFNARWSGDFNTY